MPARGVRVAEQLMHELADFIRREVKDPRIGMITLTGVELTADYAVATVYYTVMPSDEQTLARSQEGLTRAAGFMRGQIGRKLRIHTTPDLRFKRDPSVERGVEMSALIDKANAVRGDDFEPEPEKPKETPSSL
jgi:ribosome-binding factor A